MTVIRTAAVVVPCFNEERRLDTDQVKVLIGDERVRIVFVDDGSTDGTIALLQRLESEHPTRITVHRMPNNAGKAEAVRHGVLVALTSSPDCVGYLDADFATSADEYLRLLETLVDSPNTNVVLGARVALLGRRIERSPMRHYSGRLFGSLASAVLGLRIYDTQCGAKIFRTTPRLEQAMSSPFISRWVFDVEILSRLTEAGSGSAAVGADEFVEVPLNEWRDVAGSNLHARDAVASLIDLARIARERRRVRRRVMRPVR